MFVGVSVIDIVEDISVACVYLGQWTPVLLDGMGLDWICTEEKPLNRRVFF